MGQRADFIAVAKGELGVIEGPKENETKYGHFTKANFQPWCGSFVNWVANEVKLKIPNCVYTPAGASAFMKKKQWEDASDTAQPLPGDIAFFDFPGDNVNRISHIGIVVKDNGDGTVTCIEGNTAPDKKGDQRNGGQVCLKVRAFKKKNGSKLRRSQAVSIVGFGKPYHGYVHLQQQLQHYTWQVKQTLRLLQQQVFQVSLVQPSSGLIHQPRSLVAVPSNRKHPV